MKIKLVKPFAISAVILVTVSVLGSYYYSAFGRTELNAADMAANDTSIQESVARNGDLLVTVASAGTYVPASTVDLTFQDDGLLIELNVDLGDQVQAGDILARLLIDKTPAEQAAEIASAELELLLAQNNLIQIHQDAQLETAQSLIALENAQRDLADVADIDLELAVAEQAVHESEQAIEEAEMMLYILNSSPAQTAFDIASASLLFKEKNLQELKDQIAKIENKIKSAPSNRTRDRLKQQLLNLEVALTKQQLEVDQSLHKFNSLDDQPDDLDLALANAQLEVAQAQLNQAQDDLEELQSDLRGSNFAIAEAQLAGAQSEWELRKDGPDPNEITLAEAQIVKAKAALALAQQTQLVVDMVAPQAGTVVSLNSSIGDRVSGKTILSLADMSEPIIEVYIDEIDSAQIRVGNPVSITFDAIPELVFSGYVQSLDPSLATIGNSAALKATVHLEVVPNSIMTLPIGLNATVEVVTGEINDAILIPLEALHKQPDNSYIVYVMSGEVLEPRPVQVGLTAPTTAAISSGLQPGDRVAISGIETIQEQLYD